MSDSPEPERQSFLRNLLLELFNPFEFLLEFLGDFPTGAISCIAFLVVLGGLGLLLYGLVSILYQLVVDPNSVDIAARLDLLSIDPDKWFPRS